MKSRVLFLVGVLFGCMLALGAHVYKDFGKVVEPGVIKIMCYDSSGNKFLSEYTEYEVFAQQNPEVVLKLSDRYVSILPIGMTAICVVHKGIKSQ